MRRLRAAMIAATMVTAGLVSGLADSSPAAAAVPSGFTGVTAARLLDTRIGLGGITPGDHQTVALQVSGRGGVPAGVTAVALNVAVTGPTQAGFITVWADGAALPLASNVNFIPGQTVAKSVLAPVSAAGVVDLYNGSSGHTDLIADVTGYFGSGSVAGAYQPVAPHRLLDTRDPGVGALSSNDTGTVQVTGERAECQPGLQRPC